jgi:F-type H+-transporting ATPase subunit epsilon
MPSILEIKQDGAIKKAAVSGGIVDFTDNAAVIMVETAEWPSDIDMDRAQKAFDRAMDRIKTKEPEIDIRRAELALQRAITRLKFKQ